MISVIHPTRGRKKQALDTASKWLFRADNPWAIEYLLSVDVDDFDNWRSTIRLLPKGPLVNTCMDITVLKNTNSSAVEAINFAATRTTGDLFIVVSDDTDCPDHWDTLLLNTLEGKTDFCAKTNDGLQPTLITMPVMDRVYYERYGYIYHPEYKHMHCDEELTCVALMTGKYIRLELDFPHNHYSTGKTVMDSLNARNNATWAHGQATLNRHAKDNFGIQNPIMRREDIKWK